MQMTGFKTQNRLTDTAELEVVVKRPQEQLKLHKRSSHLQLFWKEGHLFLSVLVNSHSGIRS